MIELDKYYQPVPFVEYEKVKVRRTDCSKRYHVVKDNYGDFKDKTLIDICCANGYFMFKFLQDGGRLAMGIENKKDICDFVNGLACDKNLNIGCGKSLEVTEGHKFDVGIYLDTHFYKETEEYPEWLAKNTDVCFTSCMRNDDRDWQDANQRYVLLLKNLFKNVEPIYSGFAGRIIYKCY